MGLLRLHRQIRRASRLEAQVDRLLAEQASEWLEVMKRPGFFDRLVFARWLKKHERHAEEFLLMEAVDKALEGIDPQRQLNVAELLSTSSLDVTPISQAPPRRLRRARWVAGAAAAASLIAIGVAVFLGTRPEDFTTAVGEQRIVALEDGSKIHLNTRSRVQVSLSETSRDIRLVSGEALFKVNPDARRPFRVHAGSMTIRALGTQFNVYRNGGRTQVAVIEGRIEVSEEDATSPVRPIVLAAGEEVDGGSTGRLTKHRAADLERATAWRERRLVFRLDTLADIAAEFNRYNRTPQIRVADEAARQRKFSGVFDADDPQSLAYTLQGDAGLTLEKTGAEILIRSRY